MTTAVSTSPSASQRAHNSMQVLANGDIVDCGRLPNSARNTLYKTELCKHFTETGTCRYGTKCQFAHGEDELRGVLRHPKYKTTKCKAFLSTGKCMYGSRCRFIHDNSSPEDLSDDEDSMTRAEQDQENMKSARHHHNAARVNPRRNMAAYCFDQQDGFLLEAGIDLSVPSLKLKPVALPLFDSATRELDVTSLVLEATSSSDEDDANQDCNNQADEDVGGAFSRLSIFQKICRASD
ncbi:Aste57867_20832 [Aphanomyces stellatus]|uniref:Aste57867_20832 protein n=1 Tax=Aphanomyces stellatus TaxID=120398 RepID=A0A485LHD8_9STRA|nr:hypothetical protein As57867_020764 [Aphanomyces stellatus]VFT97511.1 Aste57867_20832 [Aphanomyces stellatus]